MALRETILAADRRIGEGIKWNAPSFRTSEDFATFHLRARDKVQLILHFGAKKRADVAGVTIDDPESLLTWLAPDRATVTFRDADEVRQRSAAMTAILRQWIERV